MTYMKVLKESGVFLWIQNSPKRKVHKRSERKRRQKIGIKMRKTIRKLDCQQKYKNELLRYLQQLL